jgi:hypothetical protein
MVSAYNRVIGYTRDYHGREILELLQNADDEGTGDLRSERAIIVLFERVYALRTLASPFRLLGLSRLSSFETTKSSELTFRALLNSDGTRALHFERRDAS